MVAIDEEIINQKGTTYDLIDKSEKLENIIKNKNDIIGDEAEKLKDEFIILKTKDLEKSISDITNKNKTLQIGIVGRVKAGKSSLLNALVFDGQSILPKAATPMTASLVILSYGEKLSAEVEFFSEEDIDNITKNAKEYEQKLETLTEQKLKELKEKQSLKEKMNKFVSLDNDLMEKAKTRALRELKDNFALTSAYEQSEQIKKSGTSINELNSTIEAETIDELKNQLTEYVGAEGKYMPFTKSVHIKLPQENLRDIQIVDTPGVNDPVQSREERTRELLKYCDVIFIVSPSGQFMSKEDTDLMDRITEKEGIRELFVVASQVDNQLFGSEKKSANGVLPNVLTNITKRLGQHMAITLKQLKIDSPEIGGAYDKLIEEGSTKVLHSSGICEVIKQNFDTQSSWDEGTKKVWDNLTRMYPDYFTNENKEISIANLDMLSNRFQVQNNIDSVREKKEEILTQRKIEFLHAKEDSLKKYLDALLKYCQQELKNLEDGDVSELEKEIEQIENTQERASENLDGTYSDLVEDLDYKLGEILDNKLSSFFSDTKGDINDAEDTREESYEVSDSSWYNPFSYGRTKTKYKTITRVRAGAVRNSIEDMVEKVEKTITKESKKYIRDWRDDIYKKLVRVVRESVGDEEINVDKIRTLLRRVVRSVKVPEIDYSSELPYSLRESGTLENSSAERFISDAQDFVSDFRGTVKNDIKSFRKELFETLNSLELSKELFGQYLKEIEKLQLEIENKEMYIDKYHMLIDELMELK